MINLLFPWMFKFEKMKRKKKKRKRFACRKYIFWMCNKLPCLWQEVMVLIFEYNKCKYQFGVCAGGKTTFCLSYSEMVYQVIYHKQKDFNKRQLRLCLCGTLISVYKQALISFKTMKLGFISQPFLNIYPPICMIST